jgi:hypothetical protein
MDWPPNRSRQGMQSIDMESNIVELALEVSVVGSLFDQTLVGEAGRVWSEGESRDDAETETCRRSERAEDTKRRDDA